MSAAPESSKAFILHSRSYRESSLLIEFFTEDLGRVSAIARSVYRGKSPKKHFLQPFVPLSACLKGKTELLYVNQVERLAFLPSLEGEGLICGLYLNELLYYTLHRDDPHPGLFDAYHKAISQIAHKTKAHPIILREFEFILIEELGYRINFEEATEKEAHYRYDPLHGFQKTYADTGFSGETIQNIAAGQWGDTATLRQAKQLTRMALSPLLAGKEIHARTLLL